MIAFKDLVPQQIQKQGFIKPPQWETVGQVVAAANDVDTGAGGGGHQCGNCHRARSQQERCVEW